MIQVYNPDNKNFSENGDMVIQPNVAELSVELNGIANVEIELPFDEYGAWEYAIKDSVVRCHTPWDKDKGQLFRVYETEKDMDSYKVYGRHIIADLINITAKDLANDDVMIVATGTVDGQGAITKLLANTGYTGHSNITTTDSVRWERKIITEALLGTEDNSYINRWKGELFYNNFNIYMNTKIGGNYGVRISYGKNLTGITENINMDGVVTRIIPVGYDGLRLTGKTPWIDSPNINKYAQVHEKVVEFSNVKVKTNSSDTDGFATVELARAELIRLANLMYTEQHVDVPTVNIKTSMEDISQTIEYKSMGYSGLEEINLGDTVSCNHYKLNIETEARCIGYRWNILTEKYIEIEIGDVTKNFFDKQADLSNAVSKVLDGGKVKADEIVGIINGFNTMFKAQKDIAQTQHVRAMFYEDLDPKSPTFGATAVGTLGLEIANKRTPDNKEWMWNTFITGGQVYADQLIGKLKTVLIESLDGSVNINLNDGEFRFGSTDGSDVATHTNHNSTWRHHNGEYTEANADGFFKNGRPYHTLMTGGTCITGGSAGSAPKTATIQLGNEWKGKDFRVIASTVDTEGGLANEYVKRIYLEVGNIDTVNARFNITGSWTAGYNGLENNKELKSMYIVIGG
jgi:phage minor structural protein